jgi:hypothetical protein
LRGALERGIEGIAEEEKGGWFNAERLP